MFNFTPLLGAQTQSTVQQSLLELDGGIKILVDCGWSPDFDASLLKELEKHVPTLSFVLLTHATLNHLGAYAHCCKHIPLFARVPVYATEPVIALGRSLLQDVYTSTPLAAAVLSAASLSENVYPYSSSQSQPSDSHRNTAILLPPPSQIEIAGYFSAIHSLKYSQPFEPTPSSFSPPLNGLTITAYSAGRTLGGTIWHIAHGQESIVYAVDWSQAREHVLAGAAWIDPTSPGEVIESLRRPTALVASARGSQRVAVTGGMKRRDEVLLELIRETIGRGGTVLIPSDSSARVLELVYFLEAQWAQAASEAQNTLNSAKLYFASSSGKSTLHNARRMLEWMDPNVQRQFENQANLGARGQGADGKKTGAAPFDLAYTKTLEKKGQINRALLREGAKVVVASDTSLEWGFSRTVLETIASDENSLVILTERNAPISESNTGLGKLLWDVWSKKAGVADYDAVSQDPPSQAFPTAGATISSRAAKIEALTGNELNVYQQYLARQRQMQNTVNTEETTAAIDASADAVDAASESSSESEDEDDDEQQGKALNATAAITHGRHKIGLTDAELGIDVLVRRKGHYDYDVRGRRGRERMYPVLKRGVQRDDEYGDAIKAEEYLRAEERGATNDEEADAAGAEAGKVGAKRKWDEVNVEAGLAGRNRNKDAASSAAKRKKTDEAQAMDGLSTNGAEDSSEDESDYEPEESEADKISGPIKAVFSQTTLTLSLRIAFVDFAGYHDKRSILHLIPLIKPRKLILVAGEAKETASLSTDCEQILHLEPGNEDISTPLNGDTVDASVDTNAWTVKLSRPLYKKLRWQNVRGLGVVALSAFLLPAINSNSKPEDEEDEEAAAKKRLKLTNGTGDAPPASSSSSDEQPPQELPLLDSTPATVSATLPIHTKSRAAHSIHVGDIRLADLRRALQAEQYAAEFRGEGLLVINNSVAVRKSATGRLEVEGMLTGMMGYQGGVDKTFWNTRRRVYDMLAVVGGA